METKYSKKTVVSIAIRSVSILTHEMRDFFARAVTLCPVLRRKRRGGIPMKAQSDQGIKFLFFISMCLAILASNANAAQKPKAAKLNKQEVQGPLLTPETPQFGVFAPNPLTQNSYYNFQNVGIAGGGNRDIVIDGLNQPELFKTQSYPQISPPAAQKKQKHDNSYDRIPARLGSACFPEHRDSASQCEEYLMGIFSKKFGCKFDPKAKEPLEVIQCNPRQSGQKYDCTFHSKNCRRIFISDTDKCQNNRIKRIASLNGERMNFCQDKEDAQANIGTWSKNGPHASAK